MSPRIDMEFFPGFILAPSTSIDASAPRLGFIQRLNSTDCRQRTALTSRFEGFIHLNKGTMLCSKDIS